MINTDTINIYYGKKYPVVCKTIFNIHKNNDNKNGDISNGTKKNIVFIKNENVENIQVEFLNKNTPETNKKVDTSDEIFAKILDKLLQTNLYDITEKKKSQFLVFVQAQYNDWVDFFHYKKNTPKDIFTICDYVNKHLQLNTFISFHFLTLSDIYIYYEMYKYFHIINGCTNTYITQYKNIFRWFRLIHSLLQHEDKQLNSYLKEHIMTIQPTTTINKNIDSKQQNKKKTPATSYESKLENAVEGKVVTRFPPEPSGYLHIGHAKAAFLNSYYANLYKGKMLLRFDDTNPVLEDIKYEQSIIEDLKMLGLQYEKISYSSDYFPLLQTYCTKLIEMGKAYADDTNVEEMRNQRGDGIESINRNNSVEQNLNIFQHMIEGDEIGQKNCIRAKIDMQCKNKCMRDPVVFRCIVDIPHHRHQYKYKCYPTYDFACPILDSLEGVTHALRTNEYSDRIEQYYWFINILNLRKVYIYEFSRIAFVKTVMSKRKLKWFVENKMVDGWLDPRMPTIKGIFRRGLTKEALFQFILEQGPSKAGNLMQWDKLWSINKQIIDPIIPRYAAVDYKNAVILKLSNLNEQVNEKIRDLHMKNKQLGTCPMYYNNEFLIELEDAQTLNENEEITLIKLGNVIIKNIIKNDNNDTNNRNNNSIKEIIGISNFSGDFKNTKKKIHWLPNIQDKIIKCTLYEYDHLITVDKFDSNDKTDWTKFINHNSKHETLVYAEIGITNLKVTDKLQFERRGYFIVDQIMDINNYHLIKIPDGKSKNMSIISTKVDPKHLAGTKK
ncbi:glutamate--tRNA ligase, putative [Hepatocystis sp. ex Piliocolobus tephrosceles]|nr:glutamate--tRNA ligase, putative [Hepatocystis sp. ex Piliocolobus tephrosceles]